MELKKGYKKTDIGVIPEDWEVLNVGDLSFFTSGIGLRISELSLNQIDNMVPVYGGNGIAGYTQKPLINKPTIVVGRVGQKCGEVYKTKGPAWITDNALYPYKIHRVLDIEFLFTVLQFRGLNEFKNRNDLPLVTQSILHAVRIAWPHEITEQRAIAKALSDVDALLESLDRLIDKKRNIKQATMQQLLTGKKRLPGFEGDWETKTFGELFNFSGGYSASRDQLSSHGYCYLHYGDIHCSTKTFVDVKNDYLSIPKLEVSLKRISPKSFLENGNVVFVDASEDDAGTSKHIVIVNEDNDPFISGLHTIVAKCKTTKLNNTFKRYCFQTDDIKKQFLFYAAGTKVTGISKSNIPNLKLSFPSIDEQIAIATILADMDAEIAALEKRQKKTNALKQAMMQELLTGKTRLV